MHRDEVHSVPPRPQVRLLRFSLRKMLIYVGLLCVFFAGMAAADGLLAVALLLVALVVGAHVLSTFVGTQLRDGASAASRWEADYGRRSSEPHLAIDQQLEPPPRGPTAQQLQGRGPVVRWLWWLVASGTVAGAGGGLWLMLQLLWPQIGAAALGTGCLAAAILGGWIAFLAASFFGITRRAWREAVDGVRQPYPPQTAPERTASDRSSAPVRR